MVTGRISSKLDRSYDYAAIYWNAFFHLLYLKKTQWYPRHEVEKMQMKRLRLLLEHAYANVPYYHRVFKEKSLRPTDIKSLKDLVKLPVLEKETIRRNFSAFLARNYMEYAPRLNRTSGSTGEPFKFYIDRKTATVGLATLWMGWSCGGYRFGDKMVILSGLALVAEQPSFLMDVMNRAILRRMKILALNIGPSFLRECVGRILGFAPKFIRGYPSTLYFFAEFVKEEGLRGIYPKAVFTTGEMLFPRQRKLIEDVMQCEVFDGYGLFDGGIGAFECEEHNGLHISMERGVVEFVDDEGNHVSEGETGRIVGTDLYNYAMPFIRYDSGDLGVFSNERCPCGRGLVLLKNIVGRTTDVLRFKNGAVISGLFHFLKDFDIRQYQVVQTGDDSMVVKIVKGKTYSENDTKQIYRVLKDAVGDEVEVKFEFVDRIPPTKSGKWKIVISMV